MADLRFVVVVSPAFVKPLLDGRKVAIVYPGASEEELAVFNRQLDKLRSAEGVNLLSVKPKDLDIEFVDVGKVKEVRGG